MNQKILVFISLLIFCCLPGCVEKQVQTKIDVENYEVSFGIFQKDTFKLKEVTTTIPLRYSESGFSFGYVIQSKDGTEFTEHSIAFPPQKGVAGAQVKETGMSNGLKGPSGRSTLGNVAHKFGFDKGDPAGLWLLEIYVDNQLIRSLQVEVVAEN